MWAVPQATARMVMSLKAAILVGTGCGSYISFTDAVQQTAVASVAAQLLYRSREPGRGSTVQTQTAPAIGDCARCKHASRLGMELGNKPARNIMHHSGKGLGRTVLGIVLVVCPVPQHALLRVACRPELAGAQPHRELRPTGHRRAALHLALHRALQQLCKHSLNETVLYTCH